MEPPAGIVRSVPLVRDRGRTHDRGRRPREPADDEQRENRVPSQWTSSGSREAEYNLRTGAEGNILSESESGTELWFGFGLPGLDRPPEGGPLTGQREESLTGLLDSVLGFVDDGGNLTRSTEYYAFGGIRVGTDPGRIGFAGARRDAANFSPVDIQQAEEDKVPTFVSTPMDYLLRYVPLPNKPGKGAFTVFPPPSECTK